ncbi:MAG: acetate kinase [Gemmatimonadota bacterium]
MLVLVLNSGSSSVKYQVIDTQAERPLVVGGVERIGSGGAILTQHRIGDGMQIKETGELVDHVDAIGAVLALVEDPERGALVALSELAAVGHRVVHGGEAFTESVRIDAAVVEGIRDCIELAPLHNPHNLAGIRAARDRLPEIPHVAVFDTAFHSTLPPKAFHYALPYSLYRRHRIRRYGFHGTSHRHVARRIGRLLGGPVEELRAISLHLGNGASACALQGGHSVETTMGFTPLEGLVMGTRSGDVDPAVILHVMAREEIPVADANSLLNKHSGLLGLSGISGDMRDLLEEEGRGNERAELALSVYVHRIRKAIGAYAAVLGGVDAVAFTGGIGENAPSIRKRCLEDLGFLGIDVDSAANDRLAGEGEEGTFHRGSTALLVVASGEELMIALEAERVLGAIPDSGAGVSAG